GQVCHGDLGRLSLVGRRVMPVECGADETRPASPAVAVFAAAVNIAGRGTNIARGEAFPSAASTKRQFVWATAAGGQVSLMRLASVLARPETVRPANSVATRAVSCMVVGV